MASQNGRKLRYAGYSRTSGERQRDNTSIPTQKDDIDRRGGSEGWKFVRHYVDEAKSGSKIAGRTAFQQMMKDAAAGHFDVIVVWDITRFARDGFDILSSARTLKRDFNVDVIDVKGRFDTRDRRRNVNNYVQAGIAEDERLSILERTKRGKIAKARALGSPVGSKRPFGRSWHWEDVRKTAGHWSILPEKKRLVDDVARRYLAGESMVALALEKGMSQSHLHRTLLHHCGSSWPQRVREPELNINEVIETKVPPLLDDATIGAIRRRTDAGKTYHRGQLKHRYLLSRFVFCSHCGCAMGGQPNPDGTLYYRHPHKKSHRACRKPMALVNAQRLEQRILLELFDTFGNPQRVQDAIRRTIPNQDQVEADRQRHDQLVLDLGKIDRQEQNVVDAIADGRLSKETSRRKLEELEARKDQLVGEEKRLAAVLDATPSAGAIKELGQRLSDEFHSKLVMMRQDIRRANMCLDDMTWEEKRTLVEMVFGGKTPDGRRCGVYIEWIDGQERHHCRRKQWQFKIEARLAFSSQGTVPAEPLDTSDWWEGEAPRQRELLEDVTRNLWS
jgi:DNA invertase Pin-like site-specific DNA recombinase